MAASRACRCVAWRSERASPSGRCTTSSAIATGSWSRSSATGSTASSVRSTRTPAADPIDATRQVFEGLDATIASAIDVWKPVFAVITTSPDLAGMGAVGDRFVQLVEGDLGKAAAAGMFAKRHRRRTARPAHLQHPDRPPRTVGRRFDRLGPVPRFVAARPRDHAGRGVGRASRHAGDAALRPADVTTPVVASVVASAPRTVGRDRVVGPAVPMGAPWPGRRDP